MFQHALPEPDPVPAAGGSSARQVDALRAGIELLTRIGPAVDPTGARVAISTTDYGSSTDLQAAVSGPGGVTKDGPDTVPVRLAALRAVADALGLPLLVTYDFPDAFGLHISLDIDGVRVRVWDHFTGDEMPPARAAFTQTDSPAADDAPGGDGEPSAADLAAIIAETPLIAAELEVVDAEIAMASDGASTWTARRLATARRDLARVAAGFTADPDTATYRPTRPSAVPGTLAAVA